MTTPNNPTPTVTPLVTTTYSVSSSVTTTKNLITNGNFEAGNSGFTSDYQYFNPTNTAFLQKAYGVVSNPNAWEIGFTSCPDHTTGTGKMIVVDGSNVNIGNNKFWKQTIPVSAGQNYTFSYWVQSLSAPNYASIVVKVNGVTIGTDSAPSVITCGNWVQYTYTWSSGVSTTAQISMEDTVFIAPGNDFAIDDIAFTTSITCTFTKSVTITVNPNPSVVVNNGVLCNTSGSNVQITATVTPAGGPYSYVWTGPTNPGNVSTFNASVVGTYTVIVTNTSTGCVSSPASGSVSNTLPSSNCASATQVCPGGGIRYCNTTGVASAGPRGCLGSTPNPAWFYLQVGTSGPIVLNISQTSTAGIGLDVDFICYGPFTAPTCGLSLNSTNTVDCNYSTSPTEICTIPNAIAGQYYMVLITNFGDAAGTILFNQTNSASAGAGTTTCIVNCPLTITGDNVICKGTSTTLTASISGATTYTWTSSVSGFTAPNSQIINVTEPGTYNLTVVKPGCTITPASFTVTNFPVPNTVIGNDLTVCNTTFDLTLNTSVITNGSPNVTISYFDSLTNLNNGIPIGANLSTYPGVDGQLIYAQVQDDVNFCTYNVPPFTLHILCTTTCDVITNPSSNQTLCVNGDPTVLSVSTNIIGTDSISFVYFNSAQTGNNMYTGGTLLSNATPAAGSASFDPPALGNSTSLPNIAGTYYVYAIANPTPTDPACRPYQLIQVIVKPLAFLNLTSAVPTTSQTVCEGSPIVAITYTFGGSATGVTVTGLPTGVTATTSGSTVTISGNPTPASNTPYTYTITTTGGNCGFPSLSGTIKVNLNASLVLTSAPSTANQAICLGSPIVDIVYTFGGSVTGVTLTGSAPTVSGLPTGVIYTISGNTITISGIPTTTVGSPFTYTITTTGGGCGTLSLGGTITVSSPATLILTSAVSTTNQIVCSGSSIINITYLFGGTATGATVTGLPTGVTFSVSGNTVIISGSPTPTGTISYTVTTTGGACGTSSLSGSITVNPVSTLTLTSAVSTTSQSICLNDSITCL